VTELLLLLAGISKASDAWLVRFLGRHYIARERLEYRIGSYVTARRQAAHDMEQRAQ
jgi:uncharacterized protein (UPF0332 family)